MRSTSRLWLALPAVAALFSGVLAGLARLGVPMPAVSAQWVAIHGALMVGGFFGTVIGLERAVALGRRWPYLGPLCSALAVPVLLLAPPDFAWLAPLLLSLAALIMTAACVSVWRPNREPHLATLAVAAAAWLAGNLAWLAEAPLYAVVPLWAAFLILTIAGERLELSRLVQTPLAARRVFMLIVVALTAGALFAVFNPLGLRLFAVALLALAAWLLRYDIARRTVHTKGLTRFMALCLLSGYAWLAVAGVLGAMGALMIDHPLRDAALHALLLGFVFSMVFGHAPVIFPAVSGLKMRWHAGFYLPLLILHLTLAARVAAGLTDAFVLRQWAAVGNAIALVVFLLVVLTSVISAQLTAAPKPVRRGA